MSSSSMREPFARGLRGGLPGVRSRSRAQTTPVVALIALLAVCTGVSLYTTSLGAVTPSETENALAEPTLDRVYDAVSDGGVVSPVGLPRASAVAPDGYRLSIVVDTSKGRWTNGRRPPSQASDAGVAVDTASRPVSVAVGDGDVVWGRLRVGVWR